jgi:hypothetical protein
MKEQQTIFWARIYAAPYTKPNLKFRSATTTFELTLLTSTHTHYRYPNATSTFEIPALV